MATQQVRYVQHAAHHAEHAALETGGHFSAPHLVQHIVADLDRFSLDAAPFDDVTLLVIAT